MEKITTIELGKTLAFGYLLSSRELVCNYVVISHKDFY